MLGITGLGTGVTLGTAGMTGAAVVCVFRVTGVAGSLGEGCASCASLVGAGYGTEMQGLEEACSVAVMASGTV